jgi:hypothetical protein
VALFGTTTIDKAALFEPITPPSGIPPAQHSEKDNAEFAVIDMLGQTITLDGMHVRKIIPKNAHILYSGKAVELMDSYFVNCTFNFQYTPQAQQFADAILSHLPVNFDAS